MHVIDSEAISIFVVLKNILLFYVYGRFGCMLLCVAHVWLVPSEAMRGYQNP